ncbi:MAG TPA: vanadium-dependent haloperoxidase [Gemmatimonadaceae bacterium]|nr:vanadium-dependent haloperoxidase [Gemmatimonadaceae bacterium]
MSNRMLIVTLVLAPALGLAGCRDVPTSTTPPRAAVVAATRSQAPAPTPPAAPSSGTLRWNAVTRAYVAGLAPKPNQQVTLRAFTYLALAQWRAVAEGGGESDEEGGVRRSGAVAGASVALLSSIFPSGAAAFEAEALVEATAAGSAHAQAAFADGLAAGRAVGGAVAASAQTDRFNAVWTGTVPTGPGFWFSSATPPAPPLLPLLGQMRPFFMHSGDQFRPPPPPAFGSDEYLAALAEIRHFSDTRTPEQLAIAQYWAGTTGSLVAGFWNDQVSQLAQQHHLSERRTAQVLALANMAAMDANIACHDAKYTYWFIRPQQADHAITTPIGLPNHPSYPSNHACISGAFAYVVGALLPTERDRLATMADQAAESRLYAGIHYRFDKDAGLRIAREVSALVLQHPGE